MFLFAPEALGLVLLGLWLYCIFDVISTDESLVRNLPKGLWLMIVIFLPDVGSLAWLLLGRPLYAGWRPGDTGSRPVRRPVVRGLEDSASWTNADVDARLDAWEADLRRREAELERQKPEPEATKPEPEDPDFGFNW